ncbi:hypothetical protein PM2_03 [Pseudoalteromonas phage PM2]|nr:hypothetical protein PM2_03 [Pseudoalteromonas phage PM2]AAD43539.1 gp b [Pseudoalteromonas phage PM2]
MLNNYKSVILSPFPCCVLKSYLTVIYISFL